MAPGPLDLASELTASQAECADLKHHLEESEKRLRERTELLYDLQRQYASEHFSYQEMMRDIKTERMRLAGATADREIMTSRFEQVKSRIAFLLERIRHYEPCEDEWIGTSPVVHTHP